MGKYLEIKTAGQWEYASRVNCEGAVIVLIYHRDTHRYLMVEQFRPPVNMRVLEFPAGLIDPGETPIQTAVRELREEAGVEATPEDLIELGSAYSSVGMSDEKVYFYAIIVSSNTRILPSELQGAEFENGLVSRWVSEIDVLQTRAAKAQSILARFKAKQEQPNLMLP
ncbi:NUDIX hydrolase [Desulfurispira natronophila]|uniref:GDP-mannose pyrophosphatase n=1 Tax=Desulfurispira natronophila TaxID=682562 RepID=A0A7W7Y658_9BACT|nr:NUDIX hydrolase [Desulfurispira natronophila]MBB5022717.1 ADP-ribose pyrophosphatase [Desulfurispira natronophila]